MTSPPAGGARPRAQRAAAARVQALPTRIPVLFFWATLVVAVTVLLGVFSPPVVLGALGLVVTVTWRVVPERLPVERDSVRATVVALGLVGLWLVVNLGFTGEVLLVQRDPGFLTLEGLWLAEHPDPDIPIRSAADVVDRIPGASVTSDAFWRAGDDIYAQGAKTFPGLIAMAGWVAGQPGVLAANLLVGAVALLAVFDLARRVVGPRWGLLAMLALAVSTPLLYFTRTPFTEPTNIALTFGGLVALWGAAARPTGMRALGRFALGGAMVGASALSRIDGAAVVAGMALGLGLVAAGSRDRAHRRGRVRGFWAATVAALAMVLLGYLDVRVNSAEYLADHAWLYRPLIAMLAASVAVAAGMIAVARPAVTGWLAARSRLLGGISAGALLLLAVGLASRPLWTQRNGVVPGSGQAQFVASMQQAAGVAVDPTRSYDEMTVRWLAWYLGPITVVLAALGAAAMARVAVQHRRAELVALLVTVGVSALLYLVRPSITPDQIWAMRRFLPVVIPAALVCAVWVLRHLGRPGAGRGSRVAAAIGAGAVVLSPLATWGTLIATPEYEGRAGQVATLCAHAEGQRVVAVRGSDPPLLPTLRIVCDADVIEVRGPLTEDELAVIRRAWGGAPVLVTAYTQDEIPWPAGQPATVTTPMARWPHSLYPSRSPIRYTSSVWLGTIGADGRVTPVERAATGAAGGPA